ncbi:MAG: phosphodiester glycosidase family protein [Cyanobacteria bacterium SZAS LIN-5]|nr:phosphodiester glycosidase family protein [Cyanobacteria bacterium SZAS LIN-5]
MEKTVRNELIRPLRKFAGLLTLSAVLAGSFSLRAESLGMITPHVFRGVSPHLVPHRVPNRVPSRRYAPAPARSYQTSKSSAKSSAKARALASKKKVVAKAVNHPIQPQKFTDSMSSETLAPGVIHRFVRGPLSIHLLDIDMNSAPVKVQPTLAGDSFNQLKDVAAHARENNAIAAINANYFKTNGTPLGTLIINGEWIAGPLYDRVSMGITDNGRVKIDRVSLRGTLTTDNPEVPSLFCNTINQPRRHGSRLVVYTRRWGSFVRLPYEGCVVAVNAQGEVQDISLKEMAIPYGGYVLTDSKIGEISKLKVGDKVDLSWHTGPNDWHDVVQAVSGGPMLIKDGNLFLDLKAENFRKGWTGAQIHARTAAGVTANNHLLLATIEGPHTLWDVAKFLHKLGAVDAMNLDGGGSTTMVVHGNTVTRNANSHQRHVASSIAVVDMRTAMQNNLNRVPPETAEPTETPPAKEETSEFPVQKPSQTEEPAAVMPEAPEDLMQSPAQQPIKPPKKHLFGLFH